MRTIYKTLFSAAAGLLCLSGTAQVASYIFAQSNGSYVPVTGGTVVATATANASPGNLASTVWNLPNGSIPFPFMFNGSTYTGLNISCSGYITFGVTPPLATGGSPISATTAYDGAVSAWGRTNNGVYLLGSGPFYTSELRVEVLGSAPNRTFVIQWDKWRYSSGTTTTTWLEDFQIRLHETTNVIEVVYGPGYMVGGSLSTSGFNAQVGLRGATNADFNNRVSFGLFNASTSGTVNNASQVIGVTSGVGIFMPPPGLTYRWYPPCAMATLLTPTIAAGATLVCEGDPLNFTGAGETPYIDMSYQWQQSFSQGGPYNNVSGTSPGTNFATYQTTATPSGILYYVLTATCPGNSSSAISNEIIVDIRPLPVLGVYSLPSLNMGTDPIETCAGYTYTLTATGAASYVWTGGPATDSFVVQPAGNPSYTVTGTSVDGCISNTVLNVQVNPLPVINLAASTDSVCPGESVVIGASGSSSTYVWVNPFSNAFLITVSPSVTTTYTVFGTAANGCTNVAMKQIDVYSVSPLLPVSSATTGEICKSNKLTLSATGSSTYTWSTSNSYTVGQQVSFLPPLSNTYSLTAKDANGCQTQTVVSLVLSECVGIADNAAQFAGLQLQPNPNSGIFRVELANGMMKSYKLMDMNGKVILSRDTAEDATDLDIRELSAGIYYLRIQSDNAVETLKVIKQ